MLNSPKARTTLSLHWTLAAALVSTGGCTMVADRNQPKEEVVTTSQSLLGTPISEWSDPSENVHITLFRCDWSPPATAVTQFCTLPGQYVAVGGGAEIEGEWSPDALLRFSFPTSDLTSWVAGSSDHLIVPYSHRLRGYVLGMRMRVSGATYLSATELRNQMYVATNSTQASGGAVAAVVSLSQSPFYQSGDIMVGGGAGTFVPEDGAGQFLYGSFPALGGNTISWTAFSKDHGDPSATTVTAYAIGMRGCLAETGKCYGQYTGKSGTPVAGLYQDGYATMQRGSEVPIPMTSIGAHSREWNVGRLFTDLMPRNGGGETDWWGWPEVKSKDHYFFDDFGYLDVYGVYLYCIPNTSSCQN